MRSRFNFRANYRKSGGGASAPAKREGAARRDDGRAFNT
jgi:hypothetical protein